MALVIHLSVTAGDALHRLGVLEVRRLTRLHSREHPADEVHQYAVTLHRPLDGPYSVGLVRHRYGDGAWALAEKATALVEMP